MSLLERMAYSNGNPQRTIAALRLINQRLKRELVYITTDLFAALTEHNNERHDTVSPALGSEPVGFKGPAEIATGNPTVRGG